MSQMELLLSDLDAAGTREAVDECTKRFCMFNTKGNRRRLVEHILSLRPSRAERIPFYCRFVANLHPYVSSVGAELAEALAAEFLRLQKKKELQLRLDLKIRNIKFVAELVKFKIFAPNHLFQLWGYMLMHFAPQNVHTTGTQRALRTHARTRVISPPSLTYTIVTGRAGPGRAVVMGRDARF
jgi:regulator of nonsense transcripts 2